MEFWIIHVLIVSKLIKIEWKQNQCNKYKFTGNANLRVLNNFFKILPIPFNFYVFCTMTRKLDYLGNLRLSLRGLLWFKSCLLDPIHSLVHYTWYMLVSINNIVEILLLHRSILTLTINDMKSVCDYIWVHKPYKLIIHIVNNFIIFVLISDIRLIIVGYCITKYLIG